MELNEIIEKINIMEEMLLQASSCITKMAKRIDKLEAQMKNLGGCENVYDMPKV